MNEASLGELLRHHRLRLRLSQDELARKAEVSVRALRYIEQGKVSRPHAGSVRRLADALGLTPADLDALLHAPVTTAPAAGAVRPAGSRLRVSVLGPLELYRDGAPVDVGSAMLGTLLGLLAVQPGRVVTGDEIVDVLWGEQPPRTCAQLVHTYVGQLRRLLEPHRGPSAPSRLLRRVRSGYRLDLTADECDLVAFADLAAQARQARTGGDPRGAWELFGRCAAVWRGPVLADAGGRLRQHPAVVAVAARRIAVALDYADLAVERGTADRLIGHLRALSAEEPLHEGLAARLMLALAGGGQQAAALAVFETIRDRLDGELGMVPGRELRDARLAVSGGAEPAEPAGQRPMPAPAQRSVPAQLPADPSTFVGRDEYLRELDAALASGRSGAVQVVALSTVAGMAGVGKTALAVRWAHRVRDRFPGGQLYVDLRGHSTSPPLRPIDALAGFLLAFGVPAERIPDDVERAAALYRSELAGRRVMVLLDNAASAEQVRPLLPTGPGSFALVTSRYRMAGLAAREGARQFAVDVLRPAEAVTLLGQMLGADRVRREPEQTAELARLCAYLPLALRIAAANLASRPAHRIADHVAMLRAGDRLGALAIDGDAQTAVRATFDLSYEALPAAERRMFRLLGLVPGATLTIGAAAALAGCPHSEAARILDRLAAWHLVEEAAAARYGMHDLLRLYAAELAAAGDGPAGDGPAQDGASGDGMAGRTAATYRLGAHYLDRVTASGAVLYPHLLKLPQAEKAAGLAAETGDGRPAGAARRPTAEEALSYLDDERSNLVALLPRLLADGHRTLTWRLGEGLQGYFRRRMNLVDWQVVAQTALSAARADGNPVGQAAAELSLGSLCDFQSRVDDAVAHCTAALALARRAGWTECEAVALNNLARTYWVSGRPHDTVDHLRQALVLHRRTGRRAGEAVTLANLGVAYWELGRAAPDGGTGTGTGTGESEGRTAMLDQALAFLDEALALHRAIGDRHNETDTLRALASAQRDAGNHSTALGFAEEALALARESADIRFTSLAHNTLATVHRGMGRIGAALDQHRRALAIAREIGDRHIEAQVLIDLAGTSLAAGRREDALGQLDDARAIADRVGSGLLARKARAVLDESARDRTPA